VLDGRSFPQAVLDRLGAPGRAWIAELIEAVIEHSLEVGHVAMDPQTLAVMNELRDFMFERVYMTGELRRQQESAVEVIRKLFEHHLANPGEIPDTYREHAAEAVTQVADYVAGMTDRYALAVHERLGG
jgi:dGTPase